MRVAHLTLVQVILAVSTAQRLTSLRGCPKVSLENGIVRWRKGLLGSPNFGAFKCSSFFHLLGEKKLNCINGELSGPTPVCIAPGCDNTNKTAVENGRVKYELEGSKLSVICFEDFETHQFPVIVCNKKSYNASLPQCYHKNPALECNLDDGLCGWTQDTLDPNDWDKQFFTTPYRDQGFGPDKDHSAGGKGQYLYLDGGITDDSPNASLARLYSPVYAANYSSSACFSFWYHIFGNEKEFGSLGTLLVQQILLGEDSKMTSISYMRSKLKIQGDQGDAWYKGVLFLEATNLSFRILIQAVSGDSNVSVIAIDDFKLSSDCVNIPKNSTLILSCKYRCGSEANPLSTNNGCSCASTCYNSNNCCADFKKYCKSEDSAANISPTQEIAEETSPQYVSTTVSTPKTTHSTAATTPKITPPTTSLKTTPSTTTTTPSTTKVTPSTAVRTRPTTKLFFSKTTPKVYPWIKTTVLTIRPKITTTTKAATSSTPHATRKIQTTTTTATTQPSAYIDKYREDNVKFQPHTFESPLVSVLGTLFGIAILLVVLAVVIGTWVKLQKKKRHYSNDDHEVAFLTQNADEEPILDFSLASPQRE